MPKAKVNDLRSGDVLETVTQQRVVTADSPREDEDPDVKPSDGRPRDIFDYMRVLKPEETDTHTLWIYREYPPTDAGYIDCLKPPIDEAYVKAQFGGGTFNLLLKRGSELVRSKKFKVVGQPITPNGLSPQSTGASDLVQVVKMLRENGNGSLSPEASMALQMKAFENALAIQRASIPAPMTLEQMTNAMKNLRDMDGGGSRQPAEQPEWLKQIMTALIPAGVGLLIKMLEPKDALVTLKGLGEAFSTMKSLNGGDAAAPDMGTMLVQQGPHLLRGVADLVGELRRVEEQRAARAALTPTPVATNGLPVGYRPPGNAVPPDRRTPPDPASLPRPTPADMKNGEPDPEWVWGHVIRMCENGDDGVFAFNFLDTIDAVSMKSLRDQGITLDQLKKLIESGAIHPVLVRLVQSPNYPKFIAEFHAALMAPPESAAAA